MLSFLLKEEGFQLLLPLIAGISLGLMAGLPTLGMFCGVVVALLIKLYELSCLFRWLNNRKSTPIHSGLVGLCTERIMRKEQQLKHKLALQQTELRRYKQGMESLQEGVLTLDQQDHIVSSNAAALHLLSLREEDLGQSITGLVRHPSFIEYLNKGDYQQELQFESNQPPSYSLQIQITPFGSDQKVVLIRDVTERRRVETMRQNFIADVSHELRTPLTVMTGYLEMYTDMDLPAPVAKGLAVMQGQGERMNSLVNDLIHLSKLESVYHEHQGSWFDLTQLLNQLVLQLRPYGSNALHLDAEMTVELQGFREEMSSVINNLITNAFKYGGDADIHVSLTRVDEGVKLSVNDQGAGIPAEHLPRLTERFYRVDDSRESSIGGSGLGLAIVKHALEHHESALQVESQPHMGSEFFFILPHHRVRIS